MVMMVILSSGLRCDGEWVMGDGRRVMMMVAVVIVGVHVYREFSKNFVTIEKNEYIPTGSGVQCPQACRCRRRRCGCCCCCCCCCCRRWFCCCYGRRRATVGDARW